MDYYKNSCGCNDGKGDGKRPEKKPPKKCENRVIIKIDNSCFEYEKSRKSGKKEY